MLPGLKGSARAIIAGGEVITVTDKSLVVEFPNVGHATRAQSCLGDVQKLVDTVLGAGLTVEFTAANAKPKEEHHDIDPNELTDAPKVSAKTVEDQFSELFPGAVIVEDPKK